MGPRAGLVAVLVVFSLVLSGCSGGKPREATDGPSPVDPDTTARLAASFSFSPAVPAPGETVRFKDTSAGPVEARAWDFGDKTASTAQDPMHSYTTPGVYRVTLRVKDVQGSEASAAKLVAVQVPGQPLPTTEPDDPAPPPGFLAFGRPSTVQGSFGGEPSLAVDSEGHFFVSPPGSLYKSLDGASWTDLNYPAPISGDSHVIVDKDNRIYIADLQGGGLAPGVGLFGPSSVWASGDGGATWTAGNPAASVLPLNDRQWLASPGGKVVYMTYRLCTVPTPLGCGLGQTMLVKSTDGGTAWAPATTRSFEWTSFPVADPQDGTLYVVQSSDAGMAVAVSKDGGLTWDQKTAATRHTGTANIFVTGAVDAAGNVYIAWADADLGQSDVYMAYSTNKGQTWKGPVQVSASGGTHIMPWIAAGGDGKVVLAWYASPTTGDPNTLDAKVPWYVTVAQSLNAHDAKPVFAESRASADPIHVGAVCTSGLSCTGDRDLADFFTVQIGPDGRAAIAYAQDGTGSTTKTLFVLQNGGPSSR